MHQNPDETVRAEAVFVSHLQTSDPLSAEAVDDAVETLLRRNGPAGCAAGMAYEFGEHPDTAVRRMRWARDLVRRASRAVV
ncbi:hypothetical protein AB0J80_30900 [Actinoplanes sp. NPDC049548]|uniref:hypothetical protein n=1 Tax=Actinoplanes sp. NPDC049548 TaxID=3155152 RepID=UPI00342DBF50